MKTAFRKISWLVIARILEGILFQSFERQCDKSNWSLDLFTFTTKRDFVSRPARVLLLFKMKILDKYFGPPILINLCIKHNIRNAERLEALWSMSLLISGVICSNLGMFVTNLMHAFWASCKRYFSVPVPWMLYYSGIGIRCVNSNSNLALNECMHLHTFIETPYWSIRMYTSNVKFQSCSDHRTYKNKFTMNEINKI